MVCLEQPTNLPALITEFLLTNFIVKALKDSIWNQIVTNMRSILIASSSALRVLCPSLFAATYSRGRFFNQKIPSRVYFKYSEWLPEWHFFVCVFMSQRWAAQI